MLYLIGLGLNVKSISLQGLEIAKKCKKVYLEEYTVDFPYKIGELSEVIDKKIIPANREKVENLSIIDEAKKMDIALLIYGNPLIATTHTTLINEAKKTNIKIKVIQNASILDAVAQTGLQIYKFGKITSMPKHEKNFKPESYIEILKQNQQIKAHTLILTDIGLTFQEALNQLKESAEKNNIKLKKIIICQKLGTKNQKIMYRPIEELEEYTGVKNPHCIIIPGKLHFMEREFLDNL
jgi:diphthine synthase